MRPAARSLHQNNLNPTLIQTQRLLRWLPGLFGVRTPEYTSSRGPRALPDSEVMMSIRRGAGALLLLAAGCATPAEEPLTPASRSVQSATARVLPRAACPGDLADAGVSIEDVPGGVALDFRATAGADEVLRRAQRLARALDEHNAQARAALAQEASRRAIAQALPPGVDSREVFEASGPGGPYTGMDTDGPDLGNEVERTPGDASVVIPASARARALPDGARLLLVPHDPRNLDALRARVRQRAPLLMMGECPVLA